MSRIKENQKDNINQQVETRLHETMAGRNIAVSFEHELSIGNQSSEDIKDKNERLDFYRNFRKKLKYMNCKTWKDFGNESKKTGYETIPLKQLSKAMQTALKNTNIVSPDSKVDVIRVTSQYRVIGKYLLGVYYVMAYDIDFTAYKH